MQWDLATEPIYDGTIQFADIRVAAVPQRSRDAVLVSGIDNLRQQLTTAIATAYRSDPLNLDHGFDGLRVMSEEREPTMLQQRLRFAVLAVLQRDPRIVKVLRILVGDEIEPAPASRGQYSEPGEGYGTAKVHARFVIRSGETLDLALGPIPGGA